MVNPAKAGGGTSDEFPDGIGIGSIEPLSMEPIGIDGGKRLERCGARPGNVATQSPRSSNRSTTASPKPREPPEMIVVGDMG